MSRTTLLCSVIAGLLACAAPAAAAPRWEAFDRVPQALPAPGAHVAAARDWIVGARPGSASARVARAHAARPLRLPGAYTLPVGRARSFGLALRRRGLLRFSEPDRVLTGQSSFERPDGTATPWARGTIVPDGLVPPAKLAPIGIVDDLVDATVPDVAQVTIAKHTATKTVIGPHGTEVASVAAGIADGQGVIGIAPGAPIISSGLKSSSCAEVSNGILDVAAAGAKVLNLSLGATEDCFTLQLAVSDAFATDTLVVASSGNEFTKGNPVVYPAAYPHVISVGAVDFALDATYFSTANAALDLAAPGDDVPVAIPPKFDTDGAQDGVATDSGTSFAAPIVAGVASWLIAARPKLAPGQYADILRQSAKDIAAPGWDSSTGFGLVNLDGALKTPTPTLDPLEPNDGITFVNGSVYTVADPYVWKGGAARTIKASVDWVEDPVDVYRVRLGANRRATFRLTPSTSGNADLRVYKGSAKGLQSKVLTRSARGGGKTDTVHIRNRTGRSATFYVAVVAPSRSARSLDAPYSLQLKRG